MKKWPIPFDSPVLTAADLSVNLQRAYTLLAMSHKVKDVKPSLERVVGILENRPSDITEKR